MWIIIKGCGGEWLEGIEEEESREHRQKGQRYCQGRRRAEIRDGGRRYSYKEKGKD